MKKYALLFSVLALVSCASHDKEPPAEPVAPPPPKEETKIENLICPQVAILRDAQEAADYGGEKSAPTQLVAKARLAGIKGDCGYIADKKPTGIDIEFKLAQVAARGPRLGGNQVSFPFFIAVVDPAEKILRRETMTATFKFSSAEKVVEREEKLHIFIPLEDKALLSGPDYRVLIGFNKMAER